MIIDDERTEPDLPWHLAAGAPFVYARMRMQTQIGELKQALEKGSFLDMKLACADLLIATANLSTQYMIVCGARPSSDVVLRATRYEVKLFCEAAVSLLAECVEFAHFNPRLREQLFVCAAASRRLLDQGS